MLWSSYRAFHGSFRYRKRFIWKAAISRRCEQMRIDEKKVKFSALIVAWRQAVSVWFDSSKSSVFFFFQSLDWQRVHRCIYLLFVPLLNYQSDPIRNEASLLHLLFLWYSPRLSTMTSRCPPLTTSDVISRRIPRFLVRVIPLDACN